MTPRISKNITDFSDLLFDGQTACLLTEAKIHLRDSCRREKPAAHPLLAQPDPSCAPLLEEAQTAACARIESLASAKLGGSRNSVRQTLRAEFDRHAAADASPKRGAHPGGGDGASGAVDARSALVVATAEGEGSVTRKSFMRVHDALLSHTNKSAFKERLRSNAGAIGASRFSAIERPCDLPDPLLVPALLDQLASFCNRRELPTVAQAAIAYALVIAIHPFERANGKMARAAIQLVLSHRGAARGLVAPLSLPFSIRPHNHEKGVAAAAAGILEEDLDPVLTWIKLFAEFCDSAAASVDAFSAEAERQQRLWIETLNPRADSAVVPLVAVLPGMPLFTVASASEAIDRSVKRTSVAVAEMAEAGFIEQVTEGRRNRVYECPGIVDAYASLEGLQ